ncbi:MAG TPA: cytochrome C oxidase subunit IV family protein [Dongiaceae bacterium]|nr:cytochrome C oxidase subunit IV family protein [Dongiaceae bacterium]
MRRWITYVAGWLALLALLAASAVSAYLHLGRAQDFIPLGLAVIQAVIIIIVFMRLASGISMKWAFAGAGFFWLMILLGLSSTDYMTRVGYTP